MITDHRRVRRGRLPFLGEPASVSRKVSVQIPESCSVVESFTCYHTKIPPCRTNSPPCARRFSVIMNRADPWSRSHSLFYGCLALLVDMGDPAISRESAATPSQARIYDYILGRHNLVPRSRSQRSFSAA